MSSSGEEFDGDDDEEIDEDAAFNEDDWEKYGDWFQKEDQEEEDEDATAADAWLEGTSTGGGRA